MAALVGLVAMGACGDSDDAGEPARSGGPGLSEFQLEHGIGPITSEVSLGELDAGLVREGEEVFQFNCESCHRMDERFVGPPLGGVLERRSPAFVMNFILNPDEMARQHPEGQRMLAEYLLVMPFQNISEEQARAIVEYLRTQ